MIPQSIIDTVKERQSIMDIVAENVQLKQSGSRFSGLCPFHQEKSPSFYVNEEEGFYKCFGCGEHGDIFSFLMKTKNLSFVEAVRILAERQGLTLPSQTTLESAEEKEAKKIRIVLREVLCYVTKIFSKQLIGSDSACSYLENRGISKELMDRYQLGYAPPGWHFLLDQLTSELADTSLPSDPLKLEKLLELSGLLKHSNSSQSASQKEKAYDVFRDRIIFPIFRSDGAPIAFGGRLTSSEKKGPKYINSPETPIYEKRKTFYGLAQAISAIRKNRKVYIVEGYMDVLSLVQAGPANVIATCGTALTLDHVSILKRVSDQVTIIYDGDKAGIKAAAMSFESFAGSGLEVNICILPEGEDPDSIARKISAENTSPIEPAKIENYLSSLEAPIIEIYLGFLLQIPLQENKQKGENSTTDFLKTQVQKTSAARRGKTAREFAKIMASVSNPVEKEILVSRAAAFLGVSAESLTNMLKEESGKRTQKITKRHEQPAKKAPPPAILQAIEEDVSTQTDSDQNWHTNSWEKQIIVAVISNPKLAPEFLEWAEQERAKLNQPDSIVCITNPVLSFLEKMSSTTNPIPLPDGENTIRKHLTDSKITEPGLVEEALRQLSVGGGEPEKVLEVANIASSRLRTKLEIKQISLAETRADESEQLGLLERKLKLLREQQAR